MTLFHTSSNLNLNLHKRSNQQTQPDGLPKTYVRETEEEKRQRITELAKELNEFSSTTIVTALLIGQLHPSINE